MAVYKVHFAHLINDEVLFNYLQELGVTGYAHNDVGKTVCGTEIEPAGGFTYPGKRLYPLHFTSDWSGVTCGACIRARKKFAYKEGFDKVRRQVLVKLLNDKQEKMANLFKKLGNLHNSLEVLQVEIVTINNELSEMKEVAFVEKPLPDYVIGGTRKMET
jgi:hypothetical protein